MVSVLKCPHCSKETPWQGNPFRPFCSERCRLIDLGHWASGKYAIPAEKVEENPSNESDGDDDPDKKH